MRLVGLNAGETPRWQTSRALLVCSERGWRLRVARRLYRALGLAVD